MKGWIRWLHLPSFWGFLGTMTVMLLWIIRPEITLEAGKTGLNLCAQVIIPTLFPFFVLTNLIVSCGYHHFVARLLQPVMKPLFRMPDVAATAMTLGALGGYPMGAATTFALYDRGELDEKTASRLLGFCNFAGPGYVFGVLGFGVFHSFFIGCVLYASHMMAGILVGIFTNLDGKQPISTKTHEKIPEPMAFHLALVSAIKTAFSTALTVCGFLIFFNILIAFFQGWHLLDSPVFLLDKVGLSAMEAQGLLSGLLEITTVVAYLVPGQVTSVTLGLLGFLLGCGGLCIYFQVSAMVEHRPVTMGYYIRGKVLQGLLGCVLCPLLYHYTVATVAGFVVFLSFLFFRKNALEKSTDLEYNREKGGSCHVVPKKN